MAKVLVSFELIAKTLFPDSGVRVLGVESWDTVHWPWLAVVEIDGSGVPDCDWVEVTVTQEMRTFKFDEMKKPLDKCLAKRVEE